MQVVNPLQDLTKDRETGRMKEKTSVMVGEVLYWFPLPVDTPFP